MPGRFITFEGIEGVGKTTQIAAARDHLVARGVRVVQSREPGGTPVAEAIRELLLDPRHAAMAPESELLLVFAARAQHLAQKIRPALASGEWVLCDRFTDATYAYQGGGRGIDSGRIHAIEQWVQAGFGPDLTLLLDAPVALGMARAKARGGGDRFESEREAFFTRVRAAYLARARAEPQRFEVLDASRPQAEVSRGVCAALNRLLDDVEDE